ncbi:MAG TPA: hypothetical protein EYN93_06085 [Planctomycetaceae bacterium]|nr:hypothetical protein [Planctomycetaceae bacterium]
MDLLHELVYGRGYCLVKADEVSFLDGIKELLLDISLSDGNVADVKSVDELREKITTLPESDINSLNMKLSAYPDFSAMLVNAFSSSVRELAGGEFFLQRRSHVMFNTSDLRHTRAMSHFDGMSGISPFTFTIWIPAHDLHDNSGIWVLDQDASMQLVERESEKQCVMGKDLLGMDALEPLRMDFGTGVFFNPFVMHGAYPHDGALARIGVSTRFQSRSKPLFIRNSEFYYPYDLTA